MLVTVLLIVALATILVVVTSMMAQIERKAAANGAKIEQARANALFALDVAVNQLQREAGPDQRVTARAEILDTGSTTLNTNTVKQPLWTGVWKTGTNAPDVGSSPQRTTSLGSLSPTIAQKIASAAWLVSGTNASYDPTSFTGVTSGTNADAAVLAKNLGTNAISVVAPLVSVTRLSGSKTTTNGAYAYWVGDEGVKAKINLIDPTYGVSPATSFVLNQLHFLAPQAVPINTQSTNPVNPGLLGAANTTDVRGDPTNLSKVSSLPSLAFVPNVTLTPDAIPTHSPDVTADSYGVIANARTGGLKADLSTTFEDPALYKAFLTSKRATAAPLDDNDGDAKVFSVVANANDYFGATYPFVFGARWQGLYNYYSLYKNLIPANGLNAAASPFRGLNNYSGGNPGTTAPAMDMQAFIYNSKPSATLTAVQTPGEFYLPQLVGAGIYFSLKSEQVATPAGKPDPGAGQHYYQLRLYAEPRIAYYNPYNVTLNWPKADASTSAYQLSFYNGILSALKWTLTVTPVGTKVVDNIAIIPGLPNVTSQIVLSTDTTLSNLSSFRPGEIQVFGVNTSKQVSLSYQCTFNGKIDEIDGKTITRHLLGNGGGQSQWAYVNDPTVPAKDLVFLANDTDTLTVSTPALQFAANNGRIECKQPNGWGWPQTFSGNSSLISSLLGHGFYKELSTTPAQTAPIAQNLSDLSLTGSLPQFFGCFVFRSKGITQSRTASAPLSPMPVFASCDGNISPIPINYDALAQDIDFSLAISNPTSATEFQMTTSAPFTTGFGSQDTARDASTSGFVMKDIPRQPLVSLGQFMHMSLRNSMGTKDWVEQSSVLMPVGGSLCNPLLPLTSTSGGTSKIIMDDNYLLNDALFDDYFFSTLPPATPDASYKAVFPVLTGSTSAAFNDANILAHTVTLPNARMKFYAKNGKAPQASDSSKTNYLPHTKKCAANLLLDGAFNVNSTSVAAWAALLSSPSGNVLNYLNDGVFQAANLNGRVPILRCPSVVSRDGIDPVNTPFGGVHALTRNQITELATAIVAQVKARGPFLSMADFINRRLD
ncbi:MAG: hypothetical protein ACOYM3_22180, partial [Terrimicrobiaceae bacterium]